MQVFPNLARRIVVVLLFLLTLSARISQAQSPPPPPPGRVVLVLPFDNRSGQSNLAWIGDSFPDTLNERLTSAGFLAISRDDLQLALDHLGLPLDFRPTRATTIRIAQTLDADFVIVGSYNIQSAITSGPSARPARITVQAQVLAVNQLTLSAPLQDSTELSRLFDVQNAIAWKIARQIDPRFNVAQQTFLSASAGLKLAAFENYIRGTGTVTPQERVKRLQAALQNNAQGNPNYPAALLALGKTYYASRDYELAATTLGKIAPTDRRALESSFYLGLARFNTARYAEAETAFAFVAQRLPLPEVINNQAVASSRQGHDAVPLFQRASAADPNDPDYHYNLAVALLRRADRPGAAAEVDRALKLRSTDAEATQLKIYIAAGRNLAPTARTPSTTPDFEPLERLRRTYSESSFRQAAFQLDQMRALRLATLPPAEQATQYNQLGRDLLAEGLLPEAERQFQYALAASPNSPDARVGIAQVREQSGSPDEARAEASAALKLKPNVAAYLVLARLALRANQTADSAAQVAKALHLEPTNPAALAMRQALQARGQPLP